MTDFHRAMTFDKFCKDFKVTEAEAHDLVHHLAALRMSETLTLLNRITPDKTPDEIIKDWQRSAAGAVGG